MTICTHDRKVYFEQYPELKQILMRRLEELSNLYSGIVLDKFVIMPNHIHAIIIIGASTEENVGVALAATQSAQNNRAGASPAPTIGEIVGMFKSLCVRDWLRYIKENKVDAIGKLWQRNYYEHIVRNEDKLNKIREYIINNPLKWELDRENPDRQGSDYLEDEIFGCTRDK